MIFKGILDFLLFCFHWIKRTENDQSIYIDWFWMDRSLFAVTAMCVALTTLRCVFSLVWKSIEQTNIKNSKLTRFQCFSTTDYVSASEFKKRWMFCIFYTQSFTTESGSRVHHSKLIQMAQSFALLYRQCQDKKKYIMNTAFFYGSISSTSDFHTVIMFLVKIT